MTTHIDQDQILRLNTNGQEPVGIRLESASPVTVRLEVDGGCNCQHGSKSRPGSYIDTDFGRR